MNGERKRDRPKFAVNVGALIASETPVRANCLTCQQCKDIDLRPIAEARGEDFDLWDKRTRCQLTPGCEGINYFSYWGRGMFQNMYG